MLWHHLGLNQICEDIDGSCESGVAGVVNQLVNYIMLIQIPSIFREGRIGQTVASVRLQTLQMEQACCM